MALGMHHSILKVIPWLAHVGCEGIGTEANPGECRGPKNRDPSVEIGEDSPL